MELVTTKHGFKARKVTQAQEDAMDRINDHVFSNPIAQVNVLNENFAGIVVVYTTDGENHTPAWLVSAEGEAYPMA